MTKGDELVERGAVFLEELSQKASAHGPLFENIAADLAEDARFLRKMKPSLVLARIRGRQAQNGRPPWADAPTEVTTPSPASAPPPPAKETTMTTEKTPKKKSGGGPNPIAIVAASFVAGIVLAKWIDWRGHAHPRF